VKFIVVSLQVAFATPPSIQQCHSTVSLEAPMCPLPVGEGRVAVGDSIWCWWAFLSFSFFSLSFLNNYRLVLLIVGIST